ncbi:MAG: hypothetical protein RL227_516 [Pseudomonadota bacterium]
MTMAPMNTYCLRRPQVERVLSEMKPMIGSVTESNTRGRKNSTPHIQPGKPMSCTSTTMKMPSAAGNIWLASMPRPKATLWPKGTLWVAAGTAVVFMGLLLSS